MRRGVGSRPARRVDEEVEQPLVACGGPGDEEPAAGETRETRLGDRGCEAGGDHGVVGVATGLEHLDGSIGGQRMAGGDERVGHRQI